MLEELGVPFEQIPTSFSNGEAREPAYVAINPNAKVPALVDGETTVWESLAINLYLADRHGGGAELAPRTPRERGEALRWSFLGDG